MKIYIRKYHFNIKGAHHLIATPLCLFWTLWPARNRLVFENEGLNVQKIKTNFVTNLWAWANVSREDKTNSVVEFLTWLGSR